MRLDGIGLSSGENYSIELFSNGGIVYRKVEPEDGNPSSTRGEWINCKGKAPQNVLTYAQDFLKGFEKLDTRYGGSSERGRILLYNGNKVVVSGGLGQSNDNPDSPYSEAIPQDLRKFIETIESSTMPYAIDCVATGELFGK